MVRLKAQTFYCALNDIPYHVAITMKDFDLPLGFGMALAQNELAMAKFESMSEAEKQTLIQKTHSVTSKKEMRALVDSLLK